MQVTEQQIRVGEFTFEVDVAGTGDPVLLLHGFPASKAAWREVAGTLLRSGKRVIAPNQRGYSIGAQPAEVGAYAVQELVADAVGLLDALEVEQAQIVGHDWGSIVAWFLAVQHPERVRSLITASVPHPAAFGWALRNDPDQQQASAYFGLFRIEGKAEQVLLADDAARLKAMSAPMPESLLQAHLDCVLRPGVLTGALNWYRAMRDYRDLGPVTVPTTFIWGDQDSALRRAGALRCGEFVDAPYRFVELPGIGHWIPELAPEAVAAEVLRLG